MEYTFDLNATPNDIAEMNEVCSYYNIDFSEFLNILIHRTLNCGELPFYPTYDSPNVQEIVDALNDESTHKVFSDFDEMMQYIVNTPEEEL